MTEEIQKIPPRWLHCPRKGQLIAEKFIPFKTPLDKKYSDQIPEECRFDVDMFLLACKSYKVKIGLWIDLTNTNRFYDQKTVEALGCKYVKLSCRGHGVCPSQDQCQVFNDVCHKFMSKDPLSVIAVHCTHGFNRTGFLITSFLVERLAWSVDAAVQAFSRCRPPGIYKRDYLVELFRRYDIEEEAPDPPVLPNWCLECDDDERDDDGNKIHKNGALKGGKRKNEIKKGDVPFMDGLIPQVTQVRDQSRLSSIQQKVQHLCGWTKSGFPGSQPVSMDIQNINFLSQKPYKVSWKADGVRYMMLINGVNQVYMLDRDNAVYEVPNLTFPKRKDLKSHISVTLLDGEMVVDKVEGKNIPRYLIYDIVKFEGIDVGMTDFERRLLCINKEIIGPRHAKIQQGHLDKNKEPFSVRSKPFWDLTTTKCLLEGKFAQEMTSHETDGLIFQPVSEYVTGRCNEVLKWKPPSLNSVDFKLLIQREHKEGMLPETKGYLFVGGLDRPFGEIKGAKNLKQYDKKIIECNWDSGKNGWTFMRERTDKSFPNGFATAQSVCETIRNPVTKEKLFDMVYNHRFGRTPIRPNPTDGTPVKPENYNKDSMPPPPKIPKT